MLKRVAALGDGGDDVEVVLAEKFEDDPFAYFVADAVSRRAAQ